MTTEIVPAANPLPTQSEWGLIVAQAEALARSNLVPAAYRGKAHEIIVAALYGRELGLAPVIALNKIHVVDGRPTLSAELQLALIRRAGHEVLPGKVSAEGATVRCRRRGSDEWVEVTFTIAEAQSARLATKDNWKNYPAQMCWARAVSKAARMMFSDVLLGVSYTPEELDAEVDPMTGEALGGQVAQPITVAVAETLRARILALPAEVRAGVVAEMKSRHLVIGKFDGEQCEVAILDHRRVGEVEALIAEAGQFAPADSTEGRSPVSPSAAEALSAPVRAEMVATSEARTGDQPSASTLSTLEQQLQASIDQLAPPSAAIDALTPSSFAAATAKRDAAPSTVEQRQQVALACKEHGWDDDQRHAFVHQITKGRADGASSCTQADARRVLQALALVRAKSLKVEWFDGDDQDAHGGWVLQVVPLSKPARDWYDGRP